MNQNLPQHPFFVKFDRMVKALQGAATLKKPSKDKADAPPRRFATFQDRVFASVIDMSVIYLLLQDVFHFITVRIYRMVDGVALKAAMDAKPLDVTPLQSLQYQLGTALQTHLLHLWVLNSLVQSLVVGAVLVLVWREFHTTLGKSIIGIEFAGKNGEGKPSTRDYIVRFLGFYVSMPLMMIGFVLLGIDKQKRAWHDKIAGTTVVYSQRGHLLKWLWSTLRSQRK